MSVISNNDTWSLPEMLIPEKDKTEEWHKQIVQAIANESIEGSYTINYSLMDECYNFYNGAQTGEEYNFLQEAEDGDVLPANWINYNRIKTRIDNLLGDLSNRGYKIKVDAINRDAKVRKLELKNKMELDMKIMPFVRELEESNGIILGMPTGIPETQEELDEYFNYTYKEKSEMIMEGALKWIANRNDWEYERYALFRDVLIAGRCFVKDEIVNGIPRARRVDPRYMVFDTSSNDDFLRDSTYFGEVRYMALSEAAEQYGLTTEQLKTVYNKWTEGKRQGLSHEASPQVLVGTNIEWFRMERGELKVLVLTAVWKDFKDLRHKISVDKYGNEHIQDITTSKRKHKGEIRSNKIALWRQGTLVGGEYLVDWGEIRNQTRDIDSLHETRCPYIAYVPNYINGQGVSKVQQLKSLQTLKDITMYNIQLAMARAGAKGFVYDIGQIPDEWDVPTVIKYLKTVGIAFIDSKKDGIPSGYNQFQTIDMTLSASVGQYLSINDMIDREMDSISGLNEARQGTKQYSGQTVGVTQSLIQASSQNTAGLFNNFNIFSKQIFEHQAGLIKIAWAGKERFSPIIGDVGVDFLSEDVDLDLDDYAIIIKESPSIIDDKGQLSQFIQASLQAGQIDPLDAFKLLQEDEIDVAVRRWEKRVNDRKLEEQQFALQQQQQQSEARASIQQQALQAQILQAQTQMDGARQIQEQKGRDQRENTIAKGRIDLVREKYKNKG